jgi:hypothetical protein
MTKDEFNQLSKLEKQELITIVRNLCSRIEKLEERNSEMSWRLNPDRMGGQFTDGEINRRNEWR